MSEYANPQIQLHWANFIKSTQGVNSKKLDHSFSFRISDLNQPRFLMFTPLQRMGEIESLLLHYFIRTTEQYELLLIKRQRKGFGCCPEKNYERGVYIG